ncbi:hypothetical protein [Bacillus cereus]|uniref:hypothetical protein n=1 Tax=Bacillus cereus TaxID=1396 RepID=UPI003628CE43
MGNLLSFIGTASALITVIIGTLTLVINAISYQKLKKTMSSSIEISLEISFERLFKSRLVKYLNILINFSMYKKILKEKVNKKETGQERTPELAVTELVVRHNAKNNTLAYIYAGLSLLVYIVGIRLEIFQPNYIFQLFIILMIVIIFTKQKILEYRLQKGYYGTNEYELRQILRFISDEKNKNYFNGDGSSRKIFPSTEEAVKFESDLKEFEAWGGKA